MLLTGTSSELQKLITDTASPSSIFHLSHAALSTDATIYPAPSEGTESSGKKRKLSSQDTANGTVASDTQFARYPSVFHTNKHLAQVHAEVKKQCDELAQNCVSCRARPALIYTAN